MSNEIESNLTGVINQPIAEVIPEFEAPRHDADPSWLRLHPRIRTGVVVGAISLALAGASYLSLDGQARHNTEKIASEVPTAAYAIPVTEAVAWGGAIVMLGVAGAKLGNPLKAQKKVKSLIPELRGNRIFRAGYFANVLGAVGTAAAVAVGAVTDSSIPKVAWPAFFAVSIASLAGSGLPFAPMMKRSNSANIAEATVPIEKEEE